MKRTYWQADDDHGKLNSRLYQLFFFGREDSVPTASCGHEALITTVVTNNYLVKKVYIDVGSSVDVIYYKTF